MSAPEERPMSAPRSAEGTDERSREEQRAPMSRSGEEQTAPSMLGGYDSDAGRNTHEADRPTLIPLPSLLRSLLSDHLDPGYAAAAEAKAGGAKAGRGGRRGHGRSPARW